MARPLRVEFSGAIWHVTSRGNEKSTLFLDEEDRRLFLRLLGRTVERFGWRLHGYVQMGNHYHLLVETPEPTLSRGMRELNGVYSQRFNVRHGRVGHLMQGRFKGILVERDAHLLELTRYVVLNPVRAGIVHKVGDWPWSNYRATAGLDRAPAWLETQWTLRQFGTAPSGATRSYRAFVAAGVQRAPRPLDSVSGQIFLGSERFRREVRACIGNARISEEVPRSQRLPTRPSIAEILRATAAVFGNRERDIRKRRGGPIRAIFAHLARTEGLAGFGVIGETLSVKASRASKLAVHGHRLIEADDALYKKTEIITSSWRLSGREDKVQT